MCSRVVRIPSVEVDADVTCLLAYDAGDLDAPTIRGGTTGRLTEPNPPPPKWATNPPLWRQT